MKNTELVKKIESAVHEDLITIGVFMFQTYGIPADIHLEKVNGMTFIKQMSFIAEFHKNHKRLSLQLPSVNK